MEGEGPRSRREDSHTPTGSRRMFSLDHGRPSPPPPDHASGRNNHALGTSFDSSMATPPYRRSPVSQPRPSLDLTINHVTEANGHVTGSSSGGDDEVATPTCRSTEEKGKRANHAHLNGDHASEITDEDETLFNELMDSSTEQQVVSDKKISYTDLDWGVRSNLSQAQDPPIEGGDEESSTPRPTHRTPSGGPSQLSTDDSTQSTLGGGGSSLDEGSTPQATPTSTPSNIRRWSVRKRQSYDLQEPDDAATPKASPYVRRHQSAATPQQDHAPSSESLQPEDLPSPILDPPTPFRTEILNACPEEERPDDEEGAVEQDKLAVAVQDDLMQRPDSSISYDRDMPTTPEIPALADLVFPPLSEMQGETPPTPTSPKTRLFVKSKTAPPEALLDEEFTRSVTPEVFSPAKQSISSNSVKRSKSFGNKTRIIIHQREGSLSSENSPLPSPIFHARRRISKDNAASKHYSPNSSLRKHQSSSSSTSGPSGGGTKGSPPSVAVLGLVSTTRTTPELQDIPVIQVDPLLARDYEEGSAEALEGSGVGSSVVLPPPSGFGGSPERSEGRGEGVVSGTVLPGEDPPQMDTPTTREEEPENGHAHPMHIGSSEEKSLFSFLRRNKKGSRATTPTDTPTNNDDSRHEPSPLPHQHHQMPPPPTMMSMPPPPTMMSLPPPTVAPEMSSDPALFLQPVTPVRVPTSAASHLYSPLDSRSEDTLSFEDCLETYDRYATTSGKTSRSARLVAEAEIVAQSPAAKKKEKKEKKKKKKRHGYTVAGIDAQTVKEAKKLAEEGRGKRQASDSKVNKLAREYSQRIKDIKRSSRFSVVLEEAPPSSPVPPQPVWLQELKERRVSRGQDGSLEDILNQTSGDTSSVTSGSSVAEQPHPLPRPASDDDIASRLQKDGGGRGRGVDRAEFPTEGEGQRSGKLKGWVKSLAARFGRKTEGTTL